jgi:hypothetical protein
MTAVEHSAQQDVLQYVLPVFAVTMALATPFITFKASGRGTVIEELKAAAGRRLSLISLMITLLSPAFLVSNYTQITLAQYAVYSIILSQATIVADRMAKRRALPPLLVWHSVNLLNLIGGTFSSLLQIYSTSNVGLIMTIYSISPGGDCPDDDAAVNYCSDGWIAMQLLAGFIYLVLHIFAFFIVVMRVAHSYGGEDEKPMDGVFSISTP